METPQSPLDDQSKCAKSPGDNTIDDVTTLDVDNYQVEWTINNTKVIVQAQFVSDSEGDSAQFPILRLFATDLSQERTANLRLSAVQLQTFWIQYNSLYDRIPIDALDSSECVLSTEAVRSYRIKILEYVSTKLDLFLSRSNNIMILKVSS